MPTFFHIFTKPEYPQRQFAYLKRLLFYPCSKEIFTCTRDVIRMFVAVFNILGVLKSMRFLSHDNFSMTYSKFWIRLWNRITSIKSYLLFLWSYTSLISYFKRLNTPTDNIKSNINSNNYVECLEKTFPWILHYFIMWQSSDLKQH